MEIALSGHIHMREAIEYHTQDGSMRLHQAAAVVGPAPGEADGYGPISGVTLYRVRSPRASGTGDQRVNPSSMGSSTPVTLRAASDAR